MKTTLAIISLLFVVSCSKSNSAKIETGIKDYVEKNFNDPGSYEPLETTLDTINGNKYAQYLLSSGLNDQIKQFDNDINFCLTKQKEYNSTNSKYLMYKDMIEAKTDVMNDLIREKDSIKKRHNSNEIKGYIAFHKFRAKNALGALMVSKKYFLIDSGFNVIDGFDNKEAAYSNARSKLNL